MYPILFEIPWLGWPIYSYGVMLGLSIITGWYLTLDLGERDGLPRKTMGSIYFWGIAAALAGARVLYLITNPSEFDSLRDLFRFHEGGLVAYGGFLGGLLGSWAYCRIKNIRIWAWADATAIPIALGLAITRIGCFLYGCCYGRRLHDNDPDWMSALVVRFPNWAEMEHLAGHELHGSPAFNHHVADFGLEASAAASYPIFPTQLMASINGFIAVAILLLIRRSRKFRGVVFLSFGIYYGFTRFIFEIIRDDTQRGTIGPPFLGWFGGYEGHLTTSQFIGVVTVTLSAAGIAFLYSQAKKDPEKAMSLFIKPEAAKSDDEERALSKRRRSGGKKRKKK